MRTSSGAEAAGLPDFPRSSAPWSDSGLGQWILAREMSILTDRVRRFHGDTLVWTGGAPEAAAGVKRCMVRNCFYLAVRETPGHAELANLKSRLSALPLPNGVADGFVLHHSLELEEDPREALREVGRVVAPGGRLLICAFNALSLWGLRALYGRLHDDLFTGMKFVNPLRLFDWLALLGFRLEDRAAWLGFGLPVNLARGARQLPAPGAGEAAGTGTGGMRLPGENRPAHLLAWLNRVQPPTGGILVASALKQVRGARWVGRRRTRERPRLAPVAYPKPTARQPLERSR